MCPPGVQQPSRTISSPSSTAQLCSVALCLHLKLPVLFLQMHTHVYGSLSAGGFPAHASSVPKASCHLVASVYDTHFPHMALWRSVAAGRCYSMGPARICKRGSGGAELCWSTHVLVSLCPQKFCPSALRSGSLGCISCWRNGGRKVFSVVRDTSALRLHRGGGILKWKQTHLHIGRWNPNECGKGSTEDSNQREN